MIVAEEEATEVHPDAFVTANVYVPEAKPLNVPVVPVPVFVAPPGVAVMVHVPLAGKPPRDTLPVATVQVGWVNVPILVALGVAGCELIVADEVEAEVHPAVFVTVNVYVPAANPLNVPVVPEPVVVAPPGVAVTVHVPLAGNPPNAMLPVATEQVG